MAKGAVKMQISLEKYEAMLDRIGGLEAVLDKHRREWIGVEERLPEPGKPVLALVEAEFISICIAAMINGKEWDLPPGTRKVLYWMPLPEPPEMPEKKNND